MQHFITGALGLLQLHAGYLFNHGFDMCSVCIIARGIGIDIRENR